MSENRLAFLAAAGTARHALDHAEVMERWSEPSALVQMTVGALAAHLCRAVTTVETYLAAPLRNTDDEPITAAAYFATFTSKTAQDKALDTQVRDRAEKGAADGAHAVQDRFDQALGRLTHSLGQEPEDRLLEVWNGLVMTLDEYLVTRIVELTVHTDDLCTSLGQQTPLLPGSLLTIATLVDVALIHHGDVAVVRALARRERDQIQALRVI